MIIKEMECVHSIYIAKSVLKISPHDTDSIYHEYSSTKTDAPVFHLDDGTNDLLCLFQ